MVHVRCRPACWRFGKLDHNWLEAHDNSSSSLDFQLNQSGCRRSESRCARHESRNAQRWFSAQASMVCLNSADLGLPTQIWFEPSWLNSVERADSQTSIPSRKHASAHQHTRQAGCQLAQCNARGHDLVRLRRRGVGADAFRQRKSRRLCSRRPRKSRVRTLDSERQTCFRFRDPH